MKNLFILLLILPIFSFGQVITTYYIIRHAEKDLSDLNNKNPHLIEEGKLRANRWASIFKEIPLDIVYSTNFHRTLETVTPLVKKMNLPIYRYNPKELYNDAFKKRNNGKAVLVVGHSNTTPFLANKILGKDNFSEIDESIHGNLYIIQIINNTKTSQLLYLE